MSNHTLITNVNGTIGLEVSEGYIPSRTHLMKDQESPQTERMVLAHLADAPPKRSRSRFEGLSSAYYTVSWIAGFNEKYSLALCTFVTSIVTTLAYS
jgi:hypothetical protein